jgi:hypothetical protein
MPFVAWPLRRFGSAPKPGDEAAVLLFLEQFFPQEPVLALQVRPLAQRRSSPPAGGEHLMRLDSLAILDYSLSKGDSTCLHRVIAVFGGWLWCWDS